MNNPTAMSWKVEKLAVVFKKQVSHFCPDKKKKKTAQMWYKHSIKHHVTSFVGMDYQRKFLPSTPLYKQPGPLQTMPSQQNTTNLQCSPGAPQLNQPQLHKPPGSGRVKKVVSLGTRICSVQSLYPHHLMTCPTKMLPPFAVQLRPEKPQWTTPVAEWAYVKLRWVSALFAVSKIGVFFS